MLRQNLSLNDALAIHLLNLELCEINRCPRTLIMDTPEKVLYLGPPEWVRFAREF